MGGEWRETTIGQFLAREGGNVKTGPFGTTLKASEYSKEGVPLISVGEVGYGSLRVHDKTPRAPKEVVKRLPEYVLKAGDIVFGRKGAVDRSALVKPEQSGWFLGSDGIRLRLPPSCDARFVAYQVQAPETRSWLIQHATGTTMASLNQAIIERVPIVLPPLVEQRAIAHILGTLDDKVEINSQMNNTLETMARAVFKSWFVDFDPVRAKAEGRETGLPKEISDLFPDSFEDSELGEVPKGWKVGKVGDLLALNRNGLNPGAFEDEVFEHYSIPAFDEGRTPKIEEGQSIKSNKFIVVPGCVLLSKLNPRTPRIWLPLLSSPLRAVCSTEFLVTLPKHNSSQEFLYCLLSSDNFTTEFTTLVTGTSGSHQRVRPESLLNLNSVLPPLGIVQRFTGLVSPMLHRINQNLAESGTLTAQRDTLLPKLLSGEIRIANTERLTEAV